MGFVVRDDGLESTIKLHVEENKYFEQMVNMVIVYGPVDKKSQTVKDFKEKSICFNERIKHNR